MFNYSPGSTKTEKKLLEKSLDILLFIAQII